MSTRAYLFDPFIPQPSRVARARSGWEEYQRATEVFSGFPGAAGLTREWIPGHFYPNGIQIAGIPLVVVPTLDEVGILTAAESVVSAGAAVALFAVVAGLPTALVVASSQVLQ